MSATRAGVGLGLLVAGWPVYQLTSSGDLATGDGLLRVGVVAGACALGTTLVARLVRDYADQHAAAERAARREAAERAALDALDAARQNLEQAAAAATGE